MTTETISGAGAHASVASSDRIPASKSPYSSGGNGFLTPAQITEFGRNEVLAAPDASAMVGGDAFWLYQAATTTWKRTTGDHVKAWTLSGLAASSVANTPSGNIAATNVQTALNELDAEKAALSGAVFTGQIDIRPASSTAVFPVFEADQNFSSLTLRSARTGTTTRGLLTGAAAAGTIAVPDYCVVNTPILEISARPWNGTTYGQNARAYFMASENHTVSALGVQFFIDLTPIGSTTRQNVIGVAASTGLSMYSGNVVIDNNRMFRLRAYTVATLPAAGTAGRRAYVSDATAPTYLGALTGGGAVRCPVFDNGTIWVSG